MRVSYLPTGINDFHNSGAINLIVSADDIDTITGYAMYRITARQARRIEKHFCGVFGCHCAHGAVQQLDADGTECGIFVKWCQSFNQIKGATL